MTKGKAIYESESKVKDATKFFNATFIKQSMDSDLDTTLILLREEHEIGIFCPFREFFIGKNLYEKFKKFNDDKNAIRDYLYDMIRKSQYQKITTEDTPRFIVQNKNAPEDEQKKLTMYRQNKFDFISWADFFSLWDDNDNYIVINYDDLHKIVPSSWTLYDEKQYRTAELSDEEWQQFWERAIEYKTEIA